MWTCAGMWARPGNGTAIGDALWRGRAARLRWSGCSGWTSPTRRGAARSGGASGLADPGAGRGRRGADEAAEPADGPAACRARDALREGRCRGGPATGCPGAPPPARHPLEHGRVAPAHGAAVRARDAAQHAALDRGRGRDLVSGRARHGAVVGRRGHHRDNLVSGARRSGSRCAAPIPRGRDRRVTVDPYEGEGLASDPDLIVEAVPMPEDRGARTVAAFSSRRITSRCPSRSASACRPIPTR
jgi:hypothetical protein